MDRREFLKTTFAASAATVALAESIAVPAAVTRRVELEADGPLPQMVAQERERVQTLADGTTELAPIAQHLLKEIANRLDVEGWVTALAEHHPEASPDRRLHGDSIGYQVIAYEPGVERFQGPSHVTLSDQVSALWVVPSRFTGGRREFYQVHTDMMRNGPTVEVLPVALDQLRPVVDSLVATILQRRVNVFSAGLYMPQMGGDIEGAYGIASRTYGLALRLVRCCGPDHEVVMRADLLGGTFPTESVNRA